MAVDYEVYKNTLLWIIVQAFESLNNTIHIAFTPKWT